jgi:hypothetical protein
MLASILGSAATPPSSPAVAPSGKGATLSSSDAPFPLSGAPHVDAQFDKIVSFNQMGKVPESDGTLVSSSPLVKANVLAGSSLRVLAQKNSDWRNLIKHDGPAVLITDTASAPGWSSCAPNSPKCELLATADSSGRVLITGVALLAAAAEPSDPNRRLLQCKLADFHVPGEGATMVCWHPASPVILFVARGEKLWRADLVGMGVPVDAFPPADALAAPPSPSWLNQSPAAAYAASKLDLVFAGGRQITSFDIAENNTGGFFAAVALDGGAGVHLVDEDARDSKHLSGSILWPAPLIVRLVRSKAVPSSYGVVVADGKNDLRIVSAGPGGRGVCQKIESLSPPGARLVLSSSLLLDNGTALLAVSSTEGTGLSLFSLNLFDGGNTLEHEWQFTHALRVGGCPGAVGSLILSHPHVLAAIADVDAHAHKLNTIELLVLTTAPGQVTLLRVYVKDVLPGDRQFTPIQAHSARAESASGVRGNSFEDDMPQLENDFSEPEQTPLAVEAPAAMHPSSTYIPLLNFAADDNVVARAAPEAFDSAALSSSLSSALGATLDAQSASLTGAIAIALDTSLSSIPSLIQEGFASALPAFSTISKESLTEAATAALTPVRTAALDAFVSAFRDTAVPAFERAAAAMVSQIVGSVTAELKAAVTSTTAELKAQHDGVAAELKALRDSAAADIASATTNATVELSRAIEGLKRMRTETAKNSEVSVAETARISAMLAEGAERLIAAAQTREDEIRLMTREVAELRSSLKAGSAVPAPAQHPHSVAPPRLPLIFQGGPPPGAAVAPWPTHPGGPPPGAAVAPWPTHHHPAYPSPIFSMAGALTHSEQHLSSLLVANDYVKALRACSATKTVLDLVFLSRTLAAKHRSFSFAELLAQPLCSLSAFERLALLQRIALISNAKKFIEVGAPPAADNAEGDLLSRVSLMSAVASSMRLMQDWNDATVKEHLGSVLDSARTAASAIASVMQSSFIAQAAESVKMLLAP